MISIGNQTSFAAATPLEPFAYAVTNGFDAFEWFPDKKPEGGWDEGDLDKARRREIRETARQRGIRLSVHARWQANPLLKDSFPLIWKDIELAHDLGAVLLNIHLYQEAGLAAYVLAITPLLRRAAKAGLQVSIENTPLTTPEDFNELFSRLRESGFVASLHVGMCLDLGHANLCAVTRNHYLDFVDRIDPRVPITHVHLHENWGDADTHLPLFTGPAARDDAGIRGFIERLRRRNFSSSIILEQWPHPPTLLNEARDRLIQLLSEFPAATPSPLPIPLTPALSQGERGNHPQPIRTKESPAKSISGERSSSSSRRELAAGQGAGEDAFADELIAADKRCRSWREKLEAVYNLLAAHTSRPTAAGHAPPDAVLYLVDLAIYLRFLGAGQIRCEEDGRHFRPAHHARIALQIRQRLAQITTPADAFIARQIYPWLPSSAETFQRPEPLTRIRDIAHRNDIPQDLKREIKNSLQNKLHRCAGPEDLATSTALLARITAPGANYSPEFVEQFKVFHEELKEFFNARSLEDRLKALLPSARDDEGALIRAFLAQKSAVGLAQQLAAFNSLTELRRHLVESTQSHPDSEVEQRLLADIALEDFAFVLVSELINEIETAPVDKTSGLPQGPVETLLLTVMNLWLSRIEPEECAALQSELRAWSKDFDAADSVQLLRLKATVERSRRLAEDYSDRILELFPPRVEKLGRALGVAESSIRVFCEAEIRGHLIFQLSKLASGLLRRLRAQLALPAWDVLVVGTATGRLRLADQLDELIRDQGEPALLLLGSAAGDEEISKDVAGIVLGHDLPHLSHLAVRARQAGVVLVVCEEQTELEKLKAFDGQVITLAASPEKVEWRRAQADSNVTSAQHPAAALPPTRLPAVKMSAEPSFIPLEQAVFERGGGKADGVRRLAELARRDGAGFRTPAALVVPFGVMEAAIHAKPDVERDYRQLLDGLRSADASSASSPGQETRGRGVRAPLERLRTLVGQVSVPEDIASVVGRRLGREGRFMVRSSSNCEDLAELAGAGLYESVPNVPLSGIASAVRTVWASLWTLRATLSREQSGIPHQQAHIAVLIQSMLAPDLSFVLHTVNPLDCNRSEVYAEVAVGLGETLVSGAARGTPFRLICDKHSGAVRTLAFANFSRALRPVGAGGVASETVDYSRVRLSLDAGVRQDLGRRLAAIGRLVEEALQRPQDIEGAVIGDEVYLVQSRAQQGLPSGEKIEN
jgi:phosphoglucan,water dikinase